VLELVAELSGGDRDPVGHRRKLAVESSTVSGAPTDAGPST
jgi:hypothetical protein